jgi:hypothetical protein
MASSRNAGKNKGDFIELGARLRDALARDKAEFDEITRSEGIDQRKAYYLINIANAFESAQLPRADLLKTGWTKLEMLKDRVTDPDFKDLLDKAGKLPVPELRRVLAGGEARDERHVVQLYLSKEQFEVLASVIEQYGGVRVGRTLHKREEALTRALRQLLEEHDRTN